MTISKLNVLEDSNADTEGMEEQTKTANVDISDPEALFTEIYSRVKGTPLYSSFLNGLLFINQIDNTQACSKEIWCTIEEFVVRQKVTERDVRGADERDDFPLTTQPKDILPSITSPCSTGTLPPPPPPAPPPPRGQGTVETVLDLSIHQSRNVNSNTFMGQNIISRSY
uniref:Uncharacterized protein LOC111125559 isoform X2 n=1 Tax=Crassostrea virginica TaxID=6565 RepID=A0A8B8DE33_CRAVI|nr:uncharacterized protein LOC111125559 isoform X2 [Crassostrea virginica]